MARRTYHRVGKNKRNGVQSTLRSNGFVVPRKFLDEWDDEREDVIGQPNDVVGGVHYLWPCKRARAIYVVEDIMTALRRDDEARAD
jgi:hypothetical protein